MPRVKKLSDSEKTWGMICHLSSILGAIFLPLVGGLLFPLAVWFFKKDDSSFIDSNGKSIINFILSLWLYTVLIFFIFFSIYFFIFPFVYSLYLSIVYETVATFFAFLSIVSGGIGLFFLFSLGFFVAFAWIFQWALIIYGAIRAFRGKIYRYPFSIRFLKG